MKLNTGKKALVVLAVAGLSVLAMAAAQTIEGRILPGDAEKYTGTFNSGRHRVIVDGYGSGDLDMFVYDEDGDLLAKDTLADNDPMVSFHLPYRQRITIRITNAGDYTSSYDGYVE